MPRGANSMLAWLLALASIDWPEPGGLII